MKRDVADFVEMDRAKLNHLVGEAFEDLSETELPEEISREERYSALSAITFFCRR